MIILSLILNHFKKYKNKNVCQIEISRNQSSEKQPFRVQTIWSYRGLHDFIDLMTLCYFQVVLIFSRIFKFSKNSKFLKFQTKGGFLAAWHEMYHAVPRCIQTYLHVINFRKKSRISKFSKFLKNVRLTDGFSFRLICLPKHVVYSKIDWLPYQIFFAQNWSFLVHFW